MSNLPPVPHRSQLLDDKGFLTPVWSGWFQNLFERAGGTVADTNLELYTVGVDRIDSSVAGSGLVGGSGVTISVNPDNSTLELSGDQVRIKDLGVTGAKVANGTLSIAKMLASDWSALIGTSGYQKFPSGLYIQWGVTASITSGSIGSVILPTTFPTACRQVIAGIQGNSATLTTTTGQWGTGNYSTGGFDIYNRTSVAQIFNWIAVGN